jgi:dihydrofolate reductase
MAKLVFGMSQSLDGYVDGVAGDLELPPPGPALFHHFYEWVRDLTGSVYGRRVYELMRYWDEDRPEWSAEQTRLRGGVATPGVRALVVGSLGARSRLRLSAQPERDDR